MDDESVACSGSVSESPPGQTVLGDIDWERKVESDEEGDSGEVMVEIVDSDVFVDGVSGNREDGGEAGELKVNVLETQVLWRHRDASSEDHEAEESVLSPKVDEPDEVTENGDFSSVECVYSFDGSVSELPLTGIKDSNEGASYIGCEEITMLQPATEFVSEPFEALEQNSVMDIENETKDETLNENSGSIVNPGFFNHSVEVVGGGNVQCEEEIMNETSVTAIEESVIRDEGNVVSPVLLNESIEAIVEEGNVVCQEETLQSSNIGTSNTSLNSDYEGPKYFQYGVLDGLCLDDASTNDPIDAKSDPDCSVDLNLTLSAGDPAAPIPGGKVLAAVIPKDDVSVANPECQGTAINAGKDSKLKETEVRVDDGERLIPISNSIVSNAQDDNQTFVDDFHEVNSVATRETLNIVNVGLESSQKHISVGENEEVCSLNIGGVLDFRDGNLGSKNIEYTNSDFSIETVVTQKDLVFSNEPTQLDAEVDSSELDAGEGTKMGLQSDMKDNLHSTACLSYSGKEEFLAGNMTKTCIADVEINKLQEGEYCSGQCNGDHIVEGCTTEVKLLDTEKRDFGKICAQEEVDCREPKLGSDENVYGAETSMVLEEPQKFAGGVRMNQSGYFPSPDKGQFSISDLVWGKVRSYPWWPGQIFYPSDASEKAVKYFKKDSYLVGYFGDRTFAWNDASVLKPFRSYFSQIEKQGSSESFHKAVNCALEEVSRRVELGLACSCIPEDIYNKINFLVVENTGIRKEINLSKYVDRSSGVASFEPVELLEYIMNLAPRASSAADRLEFIIARAQLSAFCSFNSYRRPTDFPSSGELLENSTGNIKISDRKTVSHKPKHIPNDSSQSRMERSLMELMGDAAYSPDHEDDSFSKDNSKPTSGKKRKTLDPLVDGSDKTVNFYAAKLSTLANQSPKPSFKIGECIRRVASQLTGSTPLIRGQIDETISVDFSKIHEQSEKQNMILSSEYSLNEILSQLQLLAQDPKKKHVFLSKIISFFSGFRSSIISSRKNKKKRPASALGSSAEDFEFDDVNDSYWTDRIVQNYSEEQLLQNSEDGTANLQVVPFNAEKVTKSGRKSNSRKRYSSKSFQNSASELGENIKQKKQESSPAELILNFTERNHAPSEINLNKMFRRFGPLMESETQVDHDSGRAKVIFKRASDAEVAHSSAEKFNIFGSLQVNYEIGYSPLISVKILPLAVPLYLEDPTVML